ncbi:MAG: hypothetical protein ACFE9L_14460 [Candidatus Hodarchaeota archaeon]
MRSFIQTNDKGFALLGLSYPRENPNSTNKTMWLLKTDNEGNAQWNQTYGPNFIEYTGMIQSDDGGFVFTSYNGDLIKTDAMGEIQWIKKVGGNLDSIIGTKDRGFALIGSRFDQTWFVKTDHLGNVEWNKTFRFNIEGDYIFHHNRSRILNIIQSSDEGFILTGSSIQNQPKGFINDLNLWLVKTNINGDLEWNLEFKEKTFASIQAVIQDKDEDLVLVGEKEHYTRLIKIDLPPFIKGDPTVGKTPFPQIAFIFLVMSSIVLFGKKKRYTLA